MSVGHRVTHIGLCVRDVGRSLEFYCNALGFAEIGRMHVDGPEAAQLLDVPGMVLDLIYLQRDGFRLELMSYIAPEVLGDESPRAMNEIGFTHLSLRVDDADELATRIEAYGGRVLADRTVTFDGGNRGVMALDPDGNRVELIERVDRGHQAP